MNILGILVLVLYVALFEMIIQVLMNKQKIKEFNDKYNKIMTTEIIGEKKEEKIIPNDVKL